MRRKQKPGLPQVGFCEEDKKNCCWFFLSPSYAAVNLSGLFFRVCPLAGLLTSDFWAERICLWTIALDQAVRLLRALMEARI